MAIAAASGVVPIASASSKIWRRVSLIWRTRRRAAAGS
jgi:hypothetical protein